MEQLTAQEAKRELRKDIRELIRKDKNVTTYIKDFEAFTGLKYSGNLSVSQLNDLIFWCINAQLSAERKNRDSIGGLI